MATIWKHPWSPYWTAVYKDEQNIWRKKSTKLRGQKNRSKAMALSIEWERAARLGRERTLTETVSREIIGGILERTTGETLRAETLREFCDRWLKAKATNKSEGTHTRYAGTVAKLLAFLDRKSDLPIAAVTPADCQRFYDELSNDGLAPATRVVEIKTLRTIFSAARRQNLISNNPADSVELPQRIKQVQRQTFTPAQVQMLMKAADGDWRTAILLGYYAGLRLSDAVTLEWDGVDLQGRRLRFAAQKTGERNEIPLHPTLDVHLSKLAGDQNGCVCPILAAVPVGGRSGLSKQFLAIMKRAGISSESVRTGGQRQLATLSFHSLRASFNSGLHNKGVSQELRKKLTGHKSDSVNDRYTRTEMTTLRAAVEKLPKLPALSH